MEARHTELALEIKSAVWHGRPGGGLGMLAWVARATGNGLGTLESGD
jgi:hypothetical protein